MRNIVLFAVSVLLLIAAAGQLAAKLNTAPKTAAITAVPIVRAPTAPREFARAPAAATQEASGPRTVTVRKDHRGHFQVDAAINGRRMNLMVDTGASVIALTERDADRLGIHPAPRDYTAKVTTANGVVHAAPTRLQAVEVGGIVVRDVTALVVPGDGLSENLLGLSFLSRLRRYEFSDSRLVLEQ